MPDRKGEETWEAIARTVDPSKANISWLAKITAIQYYHHYILHKLENPVPADRQELMETVLSTLSDEEMRFIEQEHRALPRHSY